MSAITAEQALAIAATHHEAGRLAEAEAVCRQVLAADARNAGAWRMLGEMCQQWGRIEDAASALQRAVETGDVTLSTRVNLAGVLLDLGRFDEAIAECRRVLDLAPDCVEAHNNMGNAFAQQRRWDEARACYERALAFDPGCVAVHNNLGGMLVETRRWEEAVECFERAVAIQPDFPEAHTNRGVALLECGRFDEALASYRRAIDSQPGFAMAHWKLGLLLLLLGRYEEGWKELEWRCVADVSAPQQAARAPRWKGAPVPGQTILLHSEQGFGDTLHFLRYAPFVRAHSGAARVVLNVPWQLGRLLTGSGGWQAEVVARRTGDEGPLIYFSQRASLVDLPLVLGIFEPLPMSRPYLTADRALCAEWRERLGERRAFRVGLAWAGNPRHIDDADRSICASKLLPLLRVPGVEFYSLQMGEADSRPLIDAGLIDLTHHITDFADSAALMAELDLVLAVDSAAAHLAGALGRPVWTFVRFAPDWRWGLGREDTPWYPTMRLFRQSRRGDWESVIARVSVELAALAHSAA